MPNDKFTKIFNIILVEFILLPLVLNYNGYLPREFKPDTASSSMVLSGINYKNFRVPPRDRNNLYAINTSPSWKWQKNKHLLNDAPNNEEMVQNRTIVSFPAAKYGNVLLMQQGTRYAEHIGPDGRLKASICNQPYGLLKLQRDLCLQYTDLMESVVRGYLEGIRECEFQFSTNRWNCMGHNQTIDNPRRINSLKLNRDEHLNNSKRMRTYFDRLLSSGTRESAYVLAITSAGVAHSVTRACSSGIHESCGCDRTVYEHEDRPNIEWSGCSDNIHFGSAFSRQFLDAREKSRSKRNPSLSLTNLHNNHVGRQAIMNKMEIKCKCHGVSGSCELRTCWRALPSFRTIGNFLRGSFNDAVFVEHVNNNLQKKTLPYRQLPSKLVPRSAHNGHVMNIPTKTLNELAIPSEHELTYLTRSPSYCTHDPRFGSLGTHGRRCSEDSNGYDNCQSLCCGRDYVRKMHTQEEKCFCKFHWCCEVRCQICKKTVLTTTCI